MEKSSRRKRFFRVVYSDEETTSAGQKHKRISSSENNVDSACDSDPRLNRKKPSDQLSDHYEADGFSGDWEPEYDPDPKLNNTNPSQHTDYADDGFSGEWEPESDYRRPSPSGQYYDDDTSAKKRKNWNEEETHSDSINQINPEPAKMNLVFDKTPGFRYRAEQQLGELDAAEPLIRAAWAGAFAVSDGQNTSATFQGINACLSTKACPAACAVVEQMPPSVQWEKLPRSCVWPKPFQESPVGGPTPNDIAVFFFPSLTKHGAAYDSLLFDLISDDLALRTSVHGSELLLFTSIELPPPSRRFQGKLFLWGVFRGDQPHL